MNISETRDTDIITFHSYPLLSIAVLQVIVGPIVPVESNADKQRWQKTIFSHDDKIGKEAPKSLDHTYRDKQRVP